MDKDIIKQGIDREIRRVAEDAIEKHISEACSKLRKQMMVKLDQIILECAESVTVEYEDDHLKITIKKEMTE